jgi:O-antigen ligase
MVRFFSFSAKNLLFFSVMFVLLFLGDGKQSMVDIMACAGIIGLYLVDYFTEKRIYSLPRELNIFWWSTLCYLVITTLFSESVGYSITTSMRYAMAYLIFVFFASQRKKETGHEFEDLFMRFCVAATALSFVFVIVSKLGAMLPGMNLLFPSYGHNHIVDLIVFVFPLALFRLTKRYDWKNIFLFLLFGATLLLSLSRGAMILMFAYGCFYWLTQPVANIRVKKIIGLFLVLLLFVVGGILFLSGRSFPQIKSNQILYRQVVKSPIVQSRLYYWKEAVTAIYNNPLFGSGPGTYYLLSKRYQTEPLTYSWYAHSFPLQTISELGFMGFALLCSVFIFCLYRVKNKNNALFHGVVLTLLYSMYEINLDFIVIWLLLWATLGFLYEEPAMKIYKKKQSAGVMFIFLCVLLYYLFSVCASASQILTKDPAVPLFFEPQGVGWAINYISHSDKSLLSISHVEPFIVYFHKKDPEVLIELARYKMLKHNSDAGRYFQAAINTDSQNVEYFSQYMNFLITQNDKKQIGDSLQQAGDHVSSDAERAIMQQIHFSSPLIQAAYAQEVFGFSLNPSTMKEYLSKTYYLIGLRVIQQDPQTTRFLWTLARDFSPNWGYYHVELASLTFQAFQSQEQAKKILLTCQQNIYASNQCKNTNLTDIIPGSQYENIKAIPLLNK